MMHSGQREGTQTSMRVWDQKSETVVQDAKATSICSANDHVEGAARGKLQKGPTEYLAED